jgi:hypothetical protein
MAEVKHLTQTTIDHSQYVERNRLGEVVVRKEKQQRSDYVLGVFGSRRLAKTDWVIAQLDLFVRRDRRGVLPLQILVTDGKGVAASARQWAHLHHVDVYVVPIAPYLQRWPKSEFGTLAFARRDKDLLDLVSVVVSFWEQKQQATPAIITRADQRGKLARNFYFRRRDD